MSAFLDKASRTSGFSRDLSPLPPIHQGVSTRSHTNVFSSQNLEDGHTQGSSYSLKGSVNGSLHVGSSTLKNANKHGHQGGNGAVKLTNVEAQRMMSVLTELQKKVVILGLLPDTIDRKTASMFHQETVTVMQKYKAIEGRYNQLLHTVEEGDDSEATKAELDECASNLGSATKAVCRHFLANPSAITKLRQLKSQRPNAISCFETFLWEIKTIFHERLATSVEEERSQSERLAQILSREQKVASEVNALRADVEKARNERTTEISKRNDVIKKLKEELRDIKARAEETVKTLESKSKAKEEGDLQQFAEKEKQLLAEIDALQKQLEEQRAQNREEEQNLRKKKFKIESEVENWITKYDQEMSEKQKELDEITLIYSEEKIQLDELETRFKDVQKQYDAIMDEKRSAAEQREKMETEQRRQAEAALHIQALWRGYITRLELKGMRKNKDGKKSAKKSGKKKK